jgi:UTP--glucose-1-phosphate uridylyltransferase
MPKTRVNARVRKAIFPVGGLGTRFLPATKAMPKEMLPVVDKPLIQYAVEEARAAGIEEFVFVTGRGKSAIEDHFDHSYELAETLRLRGKTAEHQALTESLPEPGQIAYTRQQEPLGLGHAVWCARNLVANEPVAVLLADDLILSDEPCLKQMMRHYEEVGGNLVAVMEVERAQIKSYGVVNPGASRNGYVEVKGLVEKPEPDVAPSNLAVIGRYILQPTVFEHLARGDRGSGGEIQLTDALARMIGQGPFHGIRFEGRRFDCGTRVGFLDANIAFALKRPDMAERVRDILQRYR